jgi:hypothetical protein
MSPLRLLPVVLLLAAVSAVPSGFAQTQSVGPALASNTNLDGKWLGSLNLGAVSLRIVFQFATTPSGLTAQMQSPDQSPAWIPASSATLEANKLHIEIPAIAGVFEGSLAHDHQQIDGTFTQMGRPLPLVLKALPAGAVTERRRPQNPVKPYPYREEEVSYPGKAAGVQLAATLTLPEGKGPFPAVLLVVGSGPHDRDESLLGHKPFLVLADALTRKGIAVLRADKRGIGKSTGNYPAATVQDFADDAEAGVEFLAKHAEIDPKRVGIVGHSEGGLVAPMVAVRNHDVAFVVMMAGPGVAGDQIIIAQSELIAKASGVPQAAIDANAATDRQVFDLVKQEKDPATLDKKLHELMTGHGAGPDAEAQIKQVETPWMRSFLTLDPAVALSHLTCPVLALNGSKDMQVPPMLNLPAIRKALDAAGNKHYEVDELPGLNHLFQTAQTGLPAEYGEIEETIAPVALDKIAAWILKQ